MPTRRTFLRTIASAAAAVGLPLPLPKVSKPATSGTIAPLKRFKQPVFVFTRRTEAKKGQLTVFIQRTGSSKLKNSLFGAQPTLEFHFAARP